VVNPQWVDTIFVRKGDFLSLSFSFNADYENAVQLYRSPEDNNWIDSRSNRGGAGPDFRLAPAKEDTWLYLIGWHKGAIYNPHLKWEQSKMRSVTDYPPRPVQKTVTSFEDGSDNDYDDVVCTYFITPRP
jgi:hypothetical protein